MSIRWTNNATSVLASDITAGSLSMTVTTGHGDRFPEVVAPHYCMVTLIDSSGNREIVKVTARASASNTLTITRAQEGTSARSFAAGSLVELRITKNAMDEVSKAADINAQHYVCDASAADQGAATNSASLKSIVDGLGATEEATIELPHTDDGDTTTYTVGTDLTIPATVTLRVHKGARISPSSGKTLTVDGIIQAGAYQIIDGDGTVTVSTYPQDQAWWGLTQRLDTAFNGYSADATAMQATTDPYPAGSPSLATSLLGEIQRLRYLVAQITGETYWYIDPDVSLATLNARAPAYETIWIPAGSMIPNTTNGPAAGTSESASNDHMQDYLSFDTTTEEFAGFNLVMPENWDRGTIKAKFYWLPSSNSGDPGNTVEWEIAAVAMSDDDALDAALGTGQVISDAVLTGESADVHVSGATPAITVGGTPALGDMIYFRVSRNVGGTDDFGYDAVLLGVLIQYQVTNTVSAW